MARLLGASSGFGFEVEPQGAQRRAHWSKRSVQGDQVLFVSTRNRTVPPHEYHGERRRLRRQAVVAMVKRHGKGIPEEQLHPHALRHLYGTELREDDVDLITRQRLMGHADPKTTAIYDHLAMRKVTRDVDRANPLAKIRTPASDLLKQLKGEA